MLRRKYARLVCGPQEAIHALAQGKQVGQHKASAGQGGHRRTLVRPT